VADNDLDLDLELDSEAKPKKRGLFGRRKKAEESAPEALPEEPATEDAAVLDESDSADVVTEKKPGFFGRMLAPVSDGASKLMPPNWTFKSFLIVLVALILLILIVENWPAMRLNFFGLHADIPKSVIIILDFALGFGVAWLVFRRSGATSGSSDS